MVCPVEHDVEGRIIIQIRLINHLLIVHYNNILTLKRLVVKYLYFKYPFIEKSYHTQHSTINVTDDLPD